MQLTLQNPDGGLFVRRVGAHAITVVDRDLSKSFVMSRDVTVEDWPVTDVSQVTVDAIEPILAQSPEVVLLGSGASLRFPDKSVMAAFLTRRIGIEVMDNAAAARTFNVLAQEGRRVVAAFILPA